MEADRGAEAAEGLLGTNPDFPRNTKVSYFSVERTDSIGLSRIGHDRRRIGQLTDNSGKTASVGLILEYIFARAPDGDSSYDVEFVRCVCSWVSGWRPL